MPDPYGMPGSYRVPEPYRPAEPDRPLTGTYRVPGYYRAPETSVAAQPYQAPEARQAADDYPVTGSDSGTGADSYSDDSYSSPGGYRSHSEYGPNDEPEPYEPPSSYESAYDEPEPYEPPEPHEPPEPYEPLSSHDLPEPYEPPEEPAASSELVPYPDPADAGDYGALGRYGETGDEPDPAPKATSGEDDYAEFWREERRGGGLHSSRTSQPKPAAAPGPPRVSGLSGLSGKVAGGSPNPVRRQVGFLIAVLAVIVAAGATAAVLLLSHHGKPNPSAANSPSNSPSHHPSSSPAATQTGPPPPPALTGAGGHLGVPKSIGTLRLNPSLTSKFVGPSAKTQVANSFAITSKDVVSGFYTTNPAATSFTTNAPRLMFLVSYLNGLGNAKSSLHSFMTDKTLIHQQQVSPGALGGVAACALLPHQTGAVTHCMWADANTYADFYAWGRSPSALAQTMIAIRSQVELGHH